MSYPDELRAIAKRVLQFEQPEEALSYPRRFLAYLMTHGTWEEVVTAEKHFADRDFQAVLDDSPPGIFDPSSCAYWNRFYGRTTIPPMPLRSIPERNWP
jgi:hypothetical protein